LGTAILKASLAKIAKGAEEIPEAVIGSAFSVWGVAVLGVLRDLVREKAAPGKRELIPFALSGSKGEPFLVQHHERDD